MRKPSGQSLVEALVALGIFSLVFGGASALLGQQLAVLDTVRQTVRSLTLAEEALSIMRSIRDRDWSLLSAGVYGLQFSGSQWTTQAAPETIDGFTRTVMVSDVNGNEKEVSATVAWLTRGFLPRSFRVVGRLSNWRNAVSALLSGNWQNPQTLGTIDLGPGNEAAALAVRSGMVYLAATASDNKKNDFFIVDATDGQNPVMRGSINTGPGLTDVAISGNYAFVSNDDDDVQMQIIDISVPAAPALITSLSLAGNNEEGTAVAANGSFVFVGTERSSSGPEFFVVDATDPFLPSIIGSLEIDDDVNGIFFHENHVYLATAKDTQEFIVIDASIPADPVAVAAVDIPGNSEEGTDAYVNFQNQRAYISRTIGGDHANHHELAVIDVSNPNIPVFLGSINFEHDVNGVFAADNLAFVVTANPNEEFQIYQVTETAAFEYYSGLNFPQVATDIAFENNIVYISVRSNDALRIITSQ